ncbi:MAG: RagB/SusD family nutrient uptake outer membrane protein [Odoribacteraceae bacterium]|nr:RagB/SusD family nutrient uptake outer membrane protein [Odoribacteraceae bacterium]
MKYFKNIIAILLLTSLASCEKWLAEVPFDKVAGDELYSTEQGAQEALNGIYLNMLDRSIYGHELTIGLIEAIAQHYYIPDPHRYDNLAAYNFTSSKSSGYISAIWSKLYKLVAACNVFLEQVELNKEKYSAAHYKLFRGEAIALRAYLHFDLFRLFAPAYTETTKTDRAIPYYTREVNAPGDYASVEQVVSYLLADVNEAITLLAADPLLEGLTTGETFWDYRNFRLNIYAAWILKARVLLHSGDKPAAYSIASALLEEKMPESGQAANFLKAFPDVLSINSAYREPLCYTEVVFGMYDVNRVEIYKNYFSADLLSENVLLAGDKRYASLFTNYDDIRAKIFQDSPTQSGVYALKNISKYLAGNLYGTDPYPYRYNVIPLIKLSELFLIAAETSDNDTDKARWLEELRLKRGYLVNNTSAFTGNLDQLLQDEYEREFYAEGHYFYYLKRNGKTSLVNQLGETVSLKATVLPVPDDETNNR